MNFKIKFWVRMKGDEEFKIYSFYESLEDVIWSFYLENLDI